jgi:polyisoprenoid-binding protein YceI
MYDVQPEQSALLIQARSNVGPIELATATVTGHAEATIIDGVLDLDQPPVAAIQIPVTSLSSGNTRYDREIHQRLDADRYPTISATLESMRQAASDNLAVSGALTIHGMTVSMAGHFDVERITANELAVVGEQTIDIRDFSISLPSTLMLRIYPEVVVRFRIEGRATAARKPGGP